MSMSNPYNTNSFTSLFDVSADRRRTLQMLSLTSNGSSSVGLSARSTCYLGSTASAAIQATSGGADLTVQSHRGNVADCSIGASGASLNVSRQDDGDRPTRSEFLSAFRANFGC